MHNTKTVRIVNKDSQQNEPPPPRKNEKKKRFKCAYYPSKFTNIEVKPEDTDAEKISERSKDGWYGKSPRDTEKGAHKGGKNKGSRKTGGNFGDRGEGSMSLGNAHRESRKGGPHGNNNRESTSGWGRSTPSGAHILTGQIIHNSYGAIMFRSGLV